ncbi:MAG TPA: carboxypeptidase-like regulatory domain-containing protein, partial [Gemmatimonadaceae bacterium]|nr:carboxypeptidase-like regulatory domain-containing protein [Gemmatimonadaceae bacterium]
IVVRSFLRAATAAALLATPIAPGLRAQQQGRAPDPRPGKGVVVGVVVDSMGRAVPGVTVYIDSRRRQVQTGDDGTFRFDGIRADTVTVATRKPGFFPEAKRVRMGPDGASAIFPLVPRVTSLPAAITEGTASGLGGIVSDSALRPLAGAQVQLVGSGAAVATTDSSGAFFVNVGPGHYLVRVADQGHVSQLVGVTIPDRGGRRLAVQLRDGYDASHARDAARMQQLQTRLMRRSPVWSKLFTSEDIAAMNASDVAALARIGANGRMDDDCLVPVDGRGVVPLWDLDPGDIEFMEVYARMPNDGMQSINPRGPTSISGARGIRTQDRAPRPSIGGASQPCSANVFIWTRK